MPLTCDFHDKESVNFKLEDTEGNCYFFCSLEEIKILLDSVERYDVLPPCGHDGKGETWTDFILRKWRGRISLDRFKYHEYDVKNKLSIHYKGKDI